MRPSSSLMTTTLSSFLVQYIQHLESQIVELKEGKAKQEELQNSILNFLKSMDYDDTINYVYF